MSTTLLLTDLHLTDPGHTIIGLDPLDRFQRVLSAALANHPDADRLVLLGDLTHHGTASEYQRLKSVLDTVQMPLALTIGNHDNRATMAEVLGQEHLNDGFVQKAWKADDTLFLLIDSVDEDGIAPKHGGWLCDARLDWVSDQIATADAQRIVCMMHHPPHAVGMPAVDGMRLANGDALYARLNAAQAPTHLICGHIHRTISGMSHGLPFTTLKSTCHQMPMDLEDSNSGLSTDEPGAYGLVLASDAGIVVHTEDVFGAPRARLSDTSSE